LGINPVSKAKIMKKLFLLFVIAASLVACNNDGASTENIEDSVLENIDSTGDARVDSVQQATDSLENKVESTFDKTDSANKVIADTMNKN
jgi:peptidoglycan hydrolase CwlO-like protein